MILTGGPGTGKTFSVRTIVTLWKAMGKKIACAAPTGRAAKRLTEMTGIEAKTIHRLLEFDSSKMGFKRDGDNLLDCSVIVIDEVNPVSIKVSITIRCVPKSPTTIRSITSPLAFTTPVIMFVLLTDAHQSDELQDAQFV